MNFADFQSKLNTQYTDIVIRWNDTPTMHKALNLLYAYNYNFVCAPNLNTAQSCADLKKDMETFFYKYMHGNAKPLLHIFYNNITNKTVHIRYFLLSHCPSAILIIFDLGQSINRKKSAIALSIILF